MQRAVEAAGRAHVQLWVCDAAEAQDALRALEGGAAGLGATRGGEAAGGEVAGEGEDGGEARGEALPVQLLVHNKVDRMAADAPQVPYEGLPPSQQWWISCTTKHGLKSFLAELSALVKSRYGAAEGEAALITRARHREHVSAALDALDAFEQLAAQGEAAPLDLACEELRNAANELGRISGRVDTEELLDIIFRDFCIGK